MSVPDGYPDTGITRDQLDLVARARVFFAHQSVGEDVLNGVRLVCADHGLAPQIAPWRPGSGVGRGITHLRVGTNGDPFGKLRCVRDLVHQGAAGRNGIVVAKLCFVDIVATTDITSLFAAYRDTLARIERDQPGLRTVAVTMPLTVDPDRVTRLKSGARALTGRPVRFGRAENAVRERFNRLIRGTYPTERVFDLAAVETGAADRTPAVPDEGSRRSTSTRPPALHRGLARDLGHLNDDGARAAALAFLATLALVAGR